MPVTSRAQPVMPGRIIVEMSTQASQIGVMITGLFWCDVHGRAGWMQVVAEIVDHLALEFRSGRSPSPYW